MATILNTRPIQASKFDKFWLTSFHIIFPSDTSSGLIIAKLHPYDGKYVISSQPKYLTIKDFKSESTDPVVESLVELIQNEAVRLHGFQQSSLHSFKVVTNDPQKATSAIFCYSDMINKRIDDCFAYASQDQQFGQNINLLLSYVAQLAKLPTIN